MSSRGAPTAPNGAASRPRRRAARARGSGDGCSRSAASRARRSPPSRPRRESRPRPSTPASATSARCSASSSRRPRAAATTSPVPEQPGPRAVAAGSDQREQLRLFAADISPAARARRPARRGAVDRRRAPIPSSRRCSRRSTTSASRTSRTFVQALAANGAAAASSRRPRPRRVWALASPELHQLLTRTRGWTRERYCELARRQPRALLLL